MPDFFLANGNCLDVLKTFPTASVDAVITDPPYSSGGMFRGDRSASTDSKYTRFESQGRRPDFAGDSRDQRGWAYWCTLWLSECLRIVKPSGYLLMFSDWRQLPTATDLFQAGGWVWRGIVPWDKGGSARAPHCGYFRHQCEYVVWGTAGACDKRRSGPWPGCFRFGVKQSDKHHQTGKPTALMSELVKVCPRGGVVLDPFMGSGTTGVAAGEAGLGFVGIEIDAGYFSIAEERIGKAYASVKHGSTDTRLCHSNA
jgi:site-specific DNA-methyltransferase (adenine-specific)